MKSMTHFETPPILITGMSGGGLSSAAKVFEDKGYYVAHNIPPRAIVDLLKLCNQEETPVGKVAAVTDVRSRMFPGSLLEIMDELTELNMKPTVLFLDARDDVLIRRFDSVRRTHPLQEGDTLKVGIQRERQAVAEVRSHADIIIDTTNLSIHDLRRAIEAAFGEMQNAKQHVTVESFGFKNGSPRDADLVVDVRFLPNPYWVPELRGYRGTDEPVAHYVLSQPAAQEFVDNFLQMFSTMLDGYRHEGKNFITLGVGCTGGHHRSVAVAEAIAARLRDNDTLDVSTLHRDIARG
ncbi:MULTISPECIES: RNase adapter RapZ [Corynebacterium]|uniref:RNase adapter RapZ n=3 Tax=Corynebacterium TaxID=1716 RepID=A0A8I1HX34_9CORY|nr:MULTISPECIES: RNase adapter RapZ [Corynebacterium]MBK3427862.1 RNase adapter RapZ [Corynebacterium tuberculostearicum]MCG7454210.1 RNase adapter RapZ [Corynebacterium tuberculostearicum]MCG7457872.1 RNase adapter RapZ [Corynebacterium tuberculostearicum]MDV2420660.1 RNase adapter RapZ [Corynebacterium tuberculostearicum]WKE51920.1 RNase adapter RapZ [Corynebacterium tuberculostearicum]